MRIACIGEAMVERLMQGDQAAVGVAGDMLNTAIYLHGCAPYLQVDCVTRLGYCDVSARSITQATRDLADLAPPSIDDEMALFDLTAAQVESRHGRGQFQWLLSWCAVQRGKSGAGYASGA